MPLSQGGGATSGLGATTGNEAPMEIDEAASAAQAKLRAQQRAETIRCVLVHLFALLLLLYCFIMSL